MKTCQIKRLIPLLLFVLLFTSCKKEFVTSSISLNNIKTKDGFPNAPFNWESNSLMMQGLPAGPAVNNVKTQVVILNPTTIYGFEGIGNRETIGSYIAYTSFSAVSTSYLKEHGAQPAYSQAAIRVSFDVVPNNGAPKSTIVKTFFANVVSI